MAQITDPGGAYAMDFKIDVYDLPPTRDQYDDARAAAPERPAPRGNAAAVPFTEVWDRPDWHRFGRCRTKDPELFFPFESKAAEIEAAKAVCAECPVREPCLLFGMTQKFGVWGGASEEDRLRLYRRIRAKRGVGPSAVITDFRLEELTA